MSGWVLLLEGKPGEREAFCVAVWWLEFFLVTVSIYASKQQQHMRFTPHMKKRERHTYIQVENREKPIPPKDNGRSSFWSRDFCHPQRLVSGFWHTLP